MATPANTWDKTLPPGSENPQNGDDRIREHKAGVEERLVDGGHLWPTGNTAGSGRHVAGVQAAGAGILELAYEADQDVMLDLRDDTAGVDPSTATLGTGVGGARPYTFRADVLRGKRLHTAAIVVPSSALGRVPGLFFINTSGGTITILKTRLSAGTAPSVGIAQMDALKYTAITTTTNPNTGGTSIYAANREPEIASGQFHSPERDLATDYAGSAFPFLNETDMLVFELDAVNSANNFVFTLGWRRVE